MSGDPDIGLAAMERADEGVQLAGSASPDAVTHATAALDSARTLTRSHRMSPDRDDGADALTAYTYALSRVARDTGDDPGRTMQLEDDARRAQGLASNYLSAGIADPGLEEAFTAARSADLAGMARSVSGSRQQLVDRDTADTISDHLTDRIGERARDLQKGKEDRIGEAAARTLDGLDLGSDQRATVESAVRAAASGHNVDPRILDNLDLGAAERDELDRTMEQARAAGLAAGSASLRQATREVHRNGSGIPDDVLDQARLSAAAGDLRPLQELGMGSVARIARSTGQAPDPATLDDLGLDADQREQLNQRVGEAVDEYRRHHVSGPEDDVLDQLARESAASDAELDAVVPDQRDPGYDGEAEDRWAGGIDQALEVDPFLFGDDPDTGNPEVDAILRARQRGEDLESGLDDAAFNRMVNQATAEGTPRTGGDVQHPGGSGDMGRFDQLTCDELDELGIDDSTVDSIEYDPATGKLIVRAVDGEPIGGELHAATAAEAARLAADTGYEMVEDFDADGTGILTAQVVDIPAAGEPGWGTVKMNRTHVFRDAGEKGWQRRPKGDLVDRWRPVSDLPPSAVNVAPGEAAAALGGRCILCGAHLKDSERHGGYGSSCAKKVVR
jgi:hypothetical protein